MIWGILIAMNRDNIGIVGLGFGKYIIENDLLGGVGKSFFKLASVCALDRDQCTAASAKYGVKAYYDLDSLLADPSIPVIGLFSGPVGRADLIRRIIEAGKDVMTTKPFELDPEAALAVLKQAKALKRVVHLNSPSPVPSRDLLQIQEWQSEFKLGRPIAAHFQTWVSYREKADGSWYDNPVQCPAAPLFRLGIYALNDIVRFFGEPESVQVTQSRIFTGRPTADTGVLTIRFKNGCLATIFASFCVGGDIPYGDVLTMNFENGTIFRDVGPRTGNQDCVMKLITGGAPSPVVREVVIPPGTRSGGYQWEVFHRAIHGEALDNPIEPAQLVAPIRIIQAMARAQHSGCTEQV